LLSFLSKGLCAQFQSHVKRSIPEGEEDVLVERGCKKEEPLWVLELVSLVSVTNECLQGFFLSLAKLNDRSCITLPLFRLRLGL
jgi:hypothetical protein